MVNFFFSIHSNLKNKVDSRLESTSHDYLELEFLGKFEALFKTIYRNQRTRLGIRGPGGVLEEKNQR
jgi:hypothetical protein